MIFFPELFSCGSFFKVKIPENKFTFHQRCNLFPVLEIVYSNVYKLIRSDVSYFDIFFLRSISAFSIRSSRPVCPATDVFSSARLIRYGRTSLTRA